MALMHGTEDAAFIATAQALDPEMEIRIQKHRQERPAQWKTYEAPFSPVRVIRRTRHKAYILDCITMLVSNLMLDAWPSHMPSGHGFQESVREHVLMTAQDLVEAMQANGADFYLVTNEVGYGLVPENPMGRMFRDLLGEVNTILAGAADRLILMVCGVPMQVKS